MSNSYVPDPILHDLYRANFNSKTFLLTPNYRQRYAPCVYDVYKQVVTTVSPVSLTLKPNYWKYCVQTEIMEFLGCFNIPHWKEPQGIVNQRHIFEAADVVLLMFMHDIVSNKATKMYPETRPSCISKPVKSIDNVCEIIKLGCKIDWNGCKQDVVNYMCAIGDIPFEILTRACAIKTMLVGMRIKNDKYVDGWSSVGSDGVHIDDRCVTYLQDEQMTPFKIYLNLLKDINLHIKR